MALKPQVERLVLLTLTAREKSPVKEDTVQETASAPCRSPLAWAQLSEGKRLQCTVVCVSPGWGAEIGCRPAWANHRPCPKRGINKTARDMPRLVKCWLWKQGACWMPRTHILRPKAVCARNPVLGREDGRIPRAPQTANRADQRALGH